MTARFAGSRSLDERRRRRLATDSENPESSKDSSAAPTTIEMPRASAPSHFPVRKAISRRLWKIWGIGMIGLASAAGILAAGQFAATQSELLGPGFVRLFSFPESRAATFFCATQLMLAGQLALLIWWVRSRSLNDFKGRYRVWTWGAMTAFLGAFAIVTDGHLAFSETVCWLWTEPFWNKEVLCWLLPTAVVGLVLTWSLKSDMRECRSSVSMLWLATVCGGLWAVLAVDLQIQIPAIVDTHRQSAQLGLGMLMTMCLFMSMLLHARYVVYNTAEPPQTHSSWFSFRWLTLKLRRGERQADLDGKKTKPTAATKKKQANKPAAKATAPDKPEKPARRAKQSKSKSAADLKVIPVSEEDFEEPPVKKSPRKARSNDNSDAMLSGEIPLDGPPDEEMLKGLSKRDRRLLRKQWRDQERSERRRA